ncbi:ABC transporter permease [Gammaproteobacteria bacterium AB-CW1]|uniref:ABC transporter permease n=3 Tax=Natronospira TaxID=2024969 RepID=A0AAP6JHN1_9GAMM|nr:ABC transporter permease [Gammaproteobacteria bacterium AB-CW1]
MKLMDLRLWYESRLAVEFLREGRAQSLLIILGVGLGVAVIVFVLALISGLQDNLIERTLGTQAHVSLQAPEEAVRVLRDPAEVDIAAQAVNERAQRLRSVQNWQALVAALEDESRVTAVSPVVSGPAFARRGQAFESVALLGIDPARYAQIVPVQEDMVAGEFRPTANEVVIGNVLADKLGVEVGDRIRLEGTDARAGNFQIAGIFSLGVRDLDERFVYLPIRPVQTLLNLPGGVTSVDVTIDEIFQAESFAEDLRLRFRVNAESWMETNEQLLNALRSQSQSTNLIQVFVGISVAFGIASVLAVSVVQRRREIGILRATGSTANQVMTVFLIQGGIVGLLGSFLGSLGGLGMVSLFTALGARPDREALFDVTAGAGLVMGAMLLATVTGILAAYFPARRAAKMDPVAAIRDE